MLSSAQLGTIFSNFVDNLSNTLVRINTNISLIITSEVYIYIVCITGFQRIVLELLPCRYIIIVMFEIDVYMVAVDSFVDARKI